MIRKLLICPWFGPLPTWMPLWERNIATLEQYGYDVLRVHDLGGFKQRVADILHIDCPIVAGEGKVHDFRHSFGLLYQDELEGYDFWGHTDFDMVYGRVERWVTDAFLDGFDIHSNHVDYISGPWTLYRNIPKINSLFAVCDDWRGILENPATTGWGEKQFTRVVDRLHVAGHIRRAYTMWQTRDLNSFDTLRFDGDRLMEGGEEVMYAHFRRTKVYPAGCLR